MPSVDFPNDMDVKVAVIADAYIYQLLMYYDEDVEKIFKVRADFDTSMDRKEESIQKFAGFIKKKKDDDGLRSFDKTAVAALVEEAVRMTGRQEKISTSFPLITDLMREADYWAGQAGKPSVR